MPPIFTLIRIKDGLIESDMIFLAQSTILETLKAQQNLVHTMIFRDIIRKIETFLLISEYLPFRRLLNRLAPVENLTYI